MAEARTRTQLPLLAGQDAFQQGIELGSKYTAVAIRRVAAWAEENPGQMLLVGLAAGLIAGKLLYRPKRIVVSAEE